MIEPAYFFDFYRTLDLAPETEVVIARADGLTSWATPRI